MREPVEIQLSNYQIDKATARLANQRLIVRRLGSNTDPHLAKVAKEHLIAMESRLAALLVKHASLLATQDSLLFDKSAGSL
jgi:hypothetical protein